MYADKERQREAVRGATRRYRLKKGITKVSPEVSDTRERVVIPKAIKTVDDLTPLPPIVTKHREYDRKFGHHPTCRCFVCVPPKEK
jgi:hypothetical protein